MRSFRYMQLAAELFVILGFVLGLVPFVYLVTAFWVIPLTVLNMVLSAVSRNQTLPFTVTNVLVAWLALVPVLGYVARVLGIILSVSSVVVLTRQDARQTETLK